MTVSTTGLSLSLSDGVLSSSFSDSFTIAVHVPEYFRYFPVTLSYIHALLSVLMAGTQSDTSLPEPFHTLKLFIVPLRLPNVRLPVDVIV